MDPLRFVLILLFATTALACSDQSDSSRITPASENTCNVSCGFDHEKTKACLEIPVVTNYAMSHLMQGLFPAVGPILAEQSLDACFCGVAVLDDSGKIASVTVADTTNVSMGNAICRAILDSDAVPIPSGAECIVGIEFPLSFNN